MLSLIPVLVAFVAAFVLMPYFVLPRPKGARSILDVVTVNLVRWMAIVIVGTHLLALLGMYEMAAIIALGVVGLYHSRLKPSGWTLIKMREVMWEALLRLLNAIDRIELRARVGITQEYTWPRLVLITSPPPGVPRRSPLRLILMAAVPATILVLAFVARVEHVAGNMSLSAPDMYHHMAWARQLSTSDLFVDGVFPYGLASVLAFIGKTNGFASLLDITRFMGPVIGTAIVYGIFYCVYRLSSNVAAATFAAGLFGLLGTRPEWHEPWERQIGALPQELAVVIALLALPAAVLAVVDEERDNLWTVAAACLAIGMTHPVPLPVYVTLCAVGAGAAGIVMGRMRRAFEVIVTAGAAALASLAYLPLSRLAGLDLFSTITNLTPLAQQGEDHRSVVLSAGEVGYGGLAAFAVPALLLGAVAGVALIVAKDGQRRSAKMLGLVAMSTVIVVLYDTAGLHLDPYYADRLAQVVGPALAIALGVGFVAINLLLPRERLGGAVVSLATAVVALMMFSSRFPAYAVSVEPVEYEAVTRVTEEISHEYERFTYTVIGTPQQRQIVVGDGWFVEAWVFARDATLRGARDPGYQVTSRQGLPRAAVGRAGLVGIPTQDVFLFIEKVPFAGPELKADGPTEEYYFDPIKRGRIMARMYLWAQMYMRYHTDMSVFYEDDEVVVYRISRAPDVAGAADTPEFKDYTWRPGRLFTTGPSDPLTVEAP